MKPHGHDTPTPLEAVLRALGEFRRSLDPIGVTPLQAGAILYLQRHRDASMTETAAALRVGLPTLSTYAALL